MDGRHLEAFFKFILVLGLLVAVSTGAIGYSCGKDNRAEQETELGDV